MIVGYLLVVRYVVSHGEIRRLTTDVCAATSIFVYTKCSIRCFRLFRLIIPHLCGTVTDDPSRRTTSPTSYVRPPKPISQPLLVRLPDACPKPRMISQCSKPSTRSLASLAPPRVEQNEQLVQNVDQRRRTTVRESAECADPGLMLPLTAARWVSTHLHPHSGR